MYGLTDSELKTICGILQNNAVSRGVIFGSRAMGNYKRGSDVDIAILGDESRVSYCLNEETNLPYFFDVINLEKIDNAKLREHIKRVGKTLI